MAGKVFFSVSMSLDGFIAPESAEDLMRQQWMELQRWAFPQRFIRGRAMNPCRSRSQHDQASDPEAGI